MKYPLEQLATIKQKRLEEAERTLREKKEQLEKEQKNLEECTKERDLVLNHRNEKLNKLDEELFAGTTSDKIEIAKRYIKIVDEDLKKKEKKMLDAKTALQKAEAAVDLARKDLLKKQHDVEKIKMHREEWEKEMRALEVIEEDRQTDEIGSAMHTLRKKKKE